MLQPPQTMLYLSFIVFLKHVIQSIDCQVFLFNKRFIHLFICLEVKLEVQTPGAALKI